MASLRASVSTASEASGRLADKWSLLLQYVDPEACPPTPAGAKPRPMPHSQEQLDAVFASLQAGLSRVRQAQVKVAQAQHVQTEMELARLQEAKSCAVCFDRDRSTVLMPCKHIVLCSHCARSKEIGHCPICRSRIESVMDIFL